MIGSRKKKAVQFVFFVSSRLIVAGDFAARNKKKKN
jgi:hypothetical protein